MSIADATVPMTNRTVLIPALAVAVSALAARTAAAAVCVQIDQQHDTLSEPDRNAAITMLSQTLRQQGLEVAEQNCMGLYVVYHVKFGNSVNVFMQGPQGYRQASARTLEEVPALYSQMVRSLIANQPMSTVNGTVDRTNVTSEQQAPNRVEADSLWYARLGYAGIANPGANTGPAIGLGYRYELDSLAIDLSFINLMFSTSNDNSTTGSSGSAGITGSWIKLMALYYNNPMANGSTYLGGGVSWGGTAVTKDDAGTFTTYSGSGLQAELTAGYEFLRASSIRMFAQFDATLPIYRVSSSDFTTGATSYAYSPSFGLSVGLGWGRSVVRIHAVP
jgi:hypothetical protein